MVKIARARVLRALALVLPYALGCSSGGATSASRVCVMGQQISCDCASGIKGVQTCDSTGTYPACTCSGDSGGAGGNASASAGATSSGGSAGSAHGGSAGTASTTGGDLGSGGVGGNVSPVAGMGGGGAASSLSGGGGNAGSAGSAGGSGGASGSANLLGSCSNIAAGKNCTEYYGDAIFTQSDKTICGNNASYTWTDSAECDRSTAVFGCKTKQEMAITWWYPPYADPSSLCAGSEVVYP